MPISGDFDDDHETQEQGRNTPRRLKRVQDRADLLHYCNHHRQVTAENAAAIRKTDEWQECWVEADQAIPLEVAPFRDADLIEQGYKRKEPYSYKDLGGTLLYSKIRYERPGAEVDKQFKLSRPATNSPTGFANGTGRLRVPYRWKELHESGLVTTVPAIPVYFTEGEKDADTLAALGLIATTTAVQKHSPVLVQAMEHRPVVILPDNDIAGEENGARAVEWFRNHAASLKVVRLPRLRRKQDVTDWFAEHGGTPEELQALVAAEPCLIEEERRSAIRASQFSLCDDDAIPWPDFLYGTAYIRGKLSITASAGGQGKSLLVMSEALAMVTGNSSLTGLAPHSPLRVWYINLEDGDDVLMPRLKGATKMHGLSNADFGNRFFVDTSDMNLVLADLDERGRVQLNPAAIARLTRQIKENAIDVVIIDPLVSAHRIPENDNSGMDLVAKEFARIARATNCAIMVVHHVTKGGQEERNANHVRGGGSLVNAARVVRVLNPMSKDDAQQVAMPEERRGFHFRVDDGKTNLAPAEKATWFERVSYEEFSFDDRRKFVVVLKPFAYSATQAGDPASILTLADVVAAFGGEGKWRERGRSDNWAGHALARRLGVGDNTPAERQALQKAIGKALVKGWLESYPAQDRHREERPHVRLAALPASAAAMSEAAE